MINFKTEIDCIKWSQLFHEDEVFEIEKGELEICEKEFPLKEKRVTDTQLK